MLPTDQWEMLVAPWSHLTLTSKRSGINLIRTKNHQLNKCLKRPEKDRESSDKIEDAFFDCYSLDGARYPESMIFSLKKILRLIYRGIIMRLEK